MKEESYHKYRTLARTAKQSTTRKWLANDNIVGVAFGRKTVHNRITDDPSIVIYVMKKMAKGLLPGSKLLPRKLYVGGDCIQVDVVETGPIYPLAFTARERPAPSGISLGHPNITAGTLGCLVNDLSDGSLCILSNNHVMADENLALLGDQILQPGPADGGIMADSIATLKRFQVINATGNIIDAAIAQVTNAANVVNQMKNNLMPVPSPEHPAVGLLFAGSASRTIMNPIRNVLAMMNIDFINGPNAIVEAEIDMAVEKVGRTTEYTTSSVLEVDVTVSVGYDFGSAEFDNQITTSCMSLGGDSGSIVCRGGEGQEANQLDCGCGSSQAARSVIQRDISSDIAAEKSFRENHLVKTRTGRYLLDVYFNNEDYITGRINKAKANEKDVAYAQNLYDKYAQTFRGMALNPDSKEKISAEHFKEGKQAFGRVMEHLDKNEQRAAEQLFQIAQNFEGKTVREALNMMDDKKIYNSVVNIISKVESLNSKDCC